MKTKEAGLRLASPVFRKRPRLSSESASFTSYLPSIQCLGCLRTSSHQFSTAAAETTDDQRKIVEEIGVQLGISKLSDWYGVTRERFAKVKGAYTLMGARRSLGTVLAKVYPDYPWDLEKFIELGRAPAGYWHNESNLVSELERAEERLGIRQPEDWYTVTLADLKQLGFSKKISKLRLAELLAERYPEVKWEKVYLLKGRYAQQKRLEKAVASLFQDKEIKVNVKKEAGLVNKSTGEYLELDIFIPSLSLAFEYQELHHYTTTRYAQSPLKDIQARDTLKRDMARAQGITLVIVPCWWDGERESLVSTIKAARPDLLADVAANAPPIPAEMPEGYRSKKVAEIEDIGEPVTACFFTLSSVNPERWWMFEKYDGVRAFWNPLKRISYSRNGKPFTFPQEIVDAMPKNLFLDGELWFGRETFTEAMKISNRVDSSQIDWSRFKYMVYDIPNHKGTYQERYNELVDYFARESSCKYIQVAERVQCEGIEHLEKYFQDIMDKGGEGVILRDPQAELQPGRSSGYLKHKKYRDAEARIIGAVGAHQWECELPNGVKFLASAGTTEFASRTLLPGDVVSFKHHGYLLNSKKPKFPTLFRVRQDLAWDDVIQNWLNREHTGQSVSAKPLRARRRISSKHYWDDQDNRRRFFIGVAERLGFDPLQYENWKNVKLSAIVNHKGLGLINKYGSLQNALAATFTEFAAKANRRKVRALQMTESKQPKGYWEDSKNARQYLSQFATEMGFDPLKADNWRTVTRRQICAAKGSGLIHVYGTLNAALENAFPEFKKSRNSA